MVDKHFIYAAKTPAYIGHDLLNMLLIIVNWIVMISAAVTRNQLVRHHPAHLHLFLQQALKQQQKGEVTLHNIQDTL